MLSLPLKHHGLTNIVALLPLREQGQAGMDLATL
jgi:hypothetical protein